VLKHMFRADPAQQSAPLYQKGLVKATLTMAADLVADSRFQTFFAKTFTWLDFC